jgi:hypothetical protein
MKKNWYTRPKPEHGTAEWLKARWKNGLSESQITASVAGVVHGAHPWVSAADLAIELLAKTPPQPTEPNEAMRRGNYFEPPIIKWVGDRENLVLSSPEVLYCYEENGVRLMATLDAVSLAEPGYQRVFEIKTSRKLWKGKLPGYWYWQGVQQAICANVTSISWAILDPEWELHQYEQKVSSDEKQKHIDACREFLAAIDCGMMPENAHPEYKHVSAIYPQSSDKSVEIPTEMMDKLKSLDAIKKQIKDFETLEDQIKTEICGLMGEAEYAQVGGTTVATWKTSTRTSLDQKKLEQDHPALVEKYRKQSTVRTFRAKL